MLQLSEKNKLLRDQMSDIMARAVFSEDVEDLVRSYSAINEANEAVGIYWCTQGKS